MSSYHRSTLEDGDRRYRKRVNRFQGGRPAAPKTEAWDDKVEEAIVMRDEHREPRGATPRGPRR